MSNKDLFSPCEINEMTGAKISARNLGDYGTEAIIDPAWEAMDYAQSAEEFYRAAAVLVFHARHLSPREHAALAEQLQRPFTRRRGAPEAVKRHEEIMRALQSTGSIALHEWHGLSRMALIEAIKVRWGLTPEAARKAYDKARRDLKRQE